MRAILYLLWSVAAILVIISLWEDASWELEYLWDDLFSEDTSSIDLGISATGEITSEKQSLTYFNFTGDTPRIFPVIFSELSDTGFADEIEKIQIDPYSSRYSLSSQITFHGQNAISCYVQTTNVSMYVARTQNFSPIVNKRALFLSTHAMGTSDAPYIVAIFIDEDTDGDGRFTCDDKQKIVSVNFQTGDRHQADLDITGSYTTLIALNHETIFVTGAIDDPRQLTYNVTNGNLVDAAFAELGE